MWVIIPPTKLKSKNSVQSRKTYFDIPDQNPWSESILFSMQDAGSLKNFAGPVMFSLLL